VLKQPSGKSAVTVGIITKDNFQPLVAIANAFHNQLGTDLVLHGSGVDDDNQ